MLDADRVVIAATVVQLLPVFLVYQSDLRLLAEDMIHVLLGGVLLYAQLSLTASGVVVVLLHGGGTLVHEGGVLWVASIIVVVAVFHDAGLLGGLLTRRADVSEPLGRVTDWHFAHSTLAHDRCVIVLVLVTLMAARVVCGSLQHRVGSYGVQLGLVLVLGYGVVFLFVLQPFLEATVL